MGWQWGGFHDVWMRYKDIDCEWYATMEADCYMSDMWFDRAISFMKPQVIYELSGHLPIGYMGQYSTHFNEHFVPPIIENYRKQNVVVDNIWRDGYNKIISPAVNDLCHTRGGFYFCRRDMLEKMDNAYGCFTHSIGNDAEFDGILLGEVGFAQKTTALGYGLYKEPNFYVGAFEHNPVPNWNELSWGDRDGKAVESTLLASYGCPEECIFCKPVIETITEPISGGENVQV